ncbi:hypothetical protein E5163_14980 [Marinicauda algicola]|uniref:Uncharacterized protein n=1 Tax=Marinicauda algicola TaxID=2029849 RepID=A0A4S2GW81_9PROT|nr:DUF6527 family protein [Marinicauda algicola]TGY87370.1 hypothetical protein E5163_14980 [Marinicauda algicola]
MPGPNRDSVPARYVPPEAFYRDARPAPGEFTVKTLPDGSRQLLAILPGDCMCTCPIRPHASPSWEFNEDLERPTLTPSIRVSDPFDKSELWHGWLREGRFVSC